MWAQEINEKEGWEAVNVCLALLPSLFFHGLHRFRD
jgi:hypothetical protein